MQRCQIIVRFAKNLLHHANLQQITYSAALPKHCEWPGLSVACTTRLNASHQLNLSFHSWWPTDMNNCVWWLPSWCRQWWTQNFLCFILELVKLLIYTGNSLHQPVPQKMQIFHKSMEILTATVQWKILLFMFLFINVHEDGLNVTILSYKSTKTRKNIHKCVPFVIWSCDPDDEHMTKIWS